MIVFLALSMGTIMLLSTVLSFGLRGPTMLASVLGVGGLCTLASPVVLWVSRTPTPAAVTFMFACWLPVSGVIWATHGPVAPATVGLVSLPVMGFFVGSRVVGVICAVLAVGQMIAVYLAFIAGFEFRDPSSDPHFEFISTLAVILVAFCLTAFVWWFDRAWRIARNETQQALSALEDANAELARARDAALHASTVKSRFLANMSHELRTPLNAIIGYAELLEEEAEPADQADLGRILTAGSHLLELVNDVLDMSRIEGEKLEIVPSRVFAAAVVDETLSAFRTQASRKGNTIVVDEVPAVHLLCDRTRVRQVLTNLLSNACKFTNDGEIRVSVAREGDTIAIRVADTGLGMSAEDQRRCFLPFEQAGPQAGGTGLGLAISRHLCRLMGGDLTVESMSDIGSTFIARLPAAREGDAMVNRSLALSR